MIVLFESDLAAIVFWMTIVAIPVVRVIVARAPYRNKMLLAVKCAPYVVAAVAVSSGCAFFMSGVTGLIGMGLLSGMACVIVACIYIETEVTRHR